MQRLPNLLMDVGLYGTIFVLPLLMGARGSVGKFALICFVGISVLGWILRSILDNRTVFRLSGLEWLLCLGGVIVCAQILPLPEQVLLALSPAHQDLLPIWFSSNEPGHIQIGSWNTLSLAPEQTKQAFAVYIAYALLFIIMIQRTDSHQDIQKFVKCLAMATVGLALLGILQFLFGNGKFLWFYNHPFRTTDDVVRGPYQNQNHFAHMMALGLGPLLWLLFSQLNLEQWRQSKTINNRRLRKSSSFTRLGSHNIFSTPVLLMTLAVAVLSLATMLTFSRGGIIVFALAGCTAAAALYFQGLWPRGVNWLVGSMLAGLILTTSIYGQEQITGRLASVVGATSLQSVSNGRYDLWNAMLTAVSKFWLTGTGIGSHADVYPVYFQKYYNFEFTHGESGYLPLLMEGGIFSLILLLCASTIVLFKLWKILNFGQLDTGSNSESPWTCGAALLTMVVVSLAHSVVDFVWYISSCMAWTVIGLALIIRLRMLATEYHCQNISGADLSNAKSTLNISSNWLVTGCSVTVAVLAFTSASIMLPAAKGAVSWNAYRVAHRESAENEGGNLPQTSNEQRHALQLLVKTVNSDPSHRKANLLLLQAYWKSARTKAISGPTLDGGGTGGREEKNALARAMIALSHHPLEGRAYMLARSAVQSQLQPGMSDLLMRQALLVRQYDGLVNMLAGTQLIEKGNFDEGFEHWRFAFNHDPDIANLMLAKLRPSFHADFLLERLKPKEEGLWQLFWAYLHAGQSSDAKLVANQLVELLKEELATDGVSSAERAKRCFELAQLNQQVGSGPEAFTLLAQAVELQPMEYQYRYCFAQECLQVGRYGEAIEALKWCLARNMDDASVAESLKLAVQQSMTSHDLR